MLTAHVTSSVGWLGAVVAYLALAIVGLTRQDAPAASSMYLAMDLVGWLVILPLCFTALATGVLQSLGTEWGLFRYWWVVAKLGLTVAATVVLVFHLPTATRMAQAAAAMTLAPGEHGPTRSQLVVHAAGGLLVLLTTTTLSIYKPWGRTPYGRRRAAQPAPERVAPSAGSPGTSWRTYLVWTLVAAVLGFVVLHVIGGGMRHD